MMSRLWIAMVAVLALTSLEPSAAQVPPPPPLPGQEKLAENLVSAFANKDETAYAALLTDNVQVYEDGDRIAANKSEWLKRFGKMLTAEGVSFKLTPGFSSTGRLLFIEYFNSMGSWWRTPPPDCCWGYDAVAYDVADGKITTIRRLRGGASRLGEKGQRTDN